MCKASHTVPVVFFFYSCKLKVTFKVLKHRYALFCFLILFLYACYFKIILKFFEEFSEIVALILDPFEM